MNLENKIIISDNNLRAKVGYLKEDMYLYHRLGDEEFKTSSSLMYCFAVMYKGKLYNIGTRSINQFRGDYNFNNAIQETLKLIEECNYKCKIEDFIKMVIQGIENKQWTPLWLLSIIEDYDKDNNTSYYQKGIKAREEIKALREKESQERERVRKEKEGQQEKERAEQKRIEEEKRAEQNFCNGFIDNLSPMRQQKVSDILNKLFRYDGVVRSRKDNVLVYLREDFVPKIRKVNCTTRGKIDQFGCRNTWDVKEKEIFTLSKDNMYLEITKTEFDYANYLLEYGLIRSRLSNEI